MIDHRLWLPLGLSLLLGFLVLEQISHRRSITSIANQIKELKAVLESYFQQESFVPNSQQGSSVPNSQQGSSVPNYQRGWKDLADPGFLEYIRKEWIHYPPTKPTKYEMKDYSQDNESSIIANELGHRRNGFFIECGAADGITGSTTLLFESMYNWTGLLVEANPNSFQQVTQAHRNAYSISVCLNDKKQTDQLTFKLNKQSGGLKRHMSKQRMKFIDKWFSESSDEATVQCLPIYSILLALGIKHVDYFSLDVEGPELDIAKTLPLDEISVDFFSLEYRIYDGSGLDAGSAKKLKSIEDFFTQTGKYKRVHLNFWDVLFKRI